MVRLLPRNAAVDQGYLTYMVAAEVKGYCRISMFLHERLVSTECGSYSLIILCSLFTESLA